MQNITYSVFSLAETDPHSEGIIFDADTSFSSFSHLNHTAAPLGIRFHRKQLRPEKEKEHADELNDAGVEMDLCRTESHSGPRCTHPSPPTAPF
ncbi:hypothetical protein [Streptomyces rubiginosohelvolus]